MITTSTVPVLLVLPPILAEVGERIVALRLNVRLELISPLLIMGTLAQIWCLLLLPTGNTSIVEIGV